MAPHVKREIYMTHVQAFGRLLITLRAEFDGDLDMMLILAVIAERYYTRSRQLQSADGVANPADRTEPRIAGINVHSIAAYSGIPRETARRKVAALLERGWIERDAANDLRPTASSAVDLAKATESTVEYLRAVGAPVD